MNFYLTVLIHICVVILGLFIYITFKDDLTNYFFLKNFFFETPNNNEFPNRYSSVFCRGNNHTNRICHFENLCYEPSTKSHIFFHNKRSIKSGLPEKRFSPTLVDFSSVEDHNTQYFNFVDLPNTVLSEFNITYHTGNFLIFKRFNSENLMHVFHDDLLPAFTTLLEIYSYDSIKKGAVRLVFADDREPGPFKDIYDNILSTKPIYIQYLPTQYLHCFQNVYIGLNKHSTWYQYGFVKPQGPLEKSLEEIYPLINLFREYFQQKFSITQTENKSCALLLTRKHNRKIRNENEIKHVIENVSGLETFVMNLEQHALLEIIAKISQCQILIGMHGSLLILSLFLREYSILIEMFPFGVNSALCTPYKTLASIPSLKLIYQDWQNSYEQNTITHPEYPSQMGGILHLSKELQNTIKNSVVKPFLCCTDPVWLYRIYQDTIVDIDSFKTSLLEALQKKEHVLQKNIAENYQLYPTEVQILSCNNTFMENKTIEVVWKKPWNVNFLRVQNIEYEIWFEDNSTNDTKAYLTKKNYFYFKDYEIGKVYYIWIRCYVNGLSGPFNSSPLICPS